MKQHLFPIILIILLGAHSAILSQNSCLKVLQANYGGTKSDIAYDVINAGNGQFYMIGNTNSFGAGGYDILVVKMDAAKNILWSNTYGVAGNETVRKASPAPDGGLLLTGQTTSFANSRGDILCMKINPDGNIQWVRTYGIGSSNGDLGSDIIQTSDGGYAITGILDVAGFVADGLVIKLDVNANQVWSKRFNSTIGEDGSAIIEVGNKLVTTFDIERQSGADYGFIITELQSSDGQALSSKLFTSTTKGIFRPIIYKDFTNGYWISGHLIAGSDYAQMEQVILKLSSSYSIIKVYKLAKTPLTNYFFTGFAPLKSGGFVTCASEPLNAGGKGHIYKIAQDGKILFAKQLSTSGKSALNALTLTGNKIITVGSDNSSGSDDYYLADFDTAGNNMDLCNIDTSIVAVQDHPFTVKDYVWSSVTDQSFSNVQKSLTTASQVIKTNPICTKDTCVVIKPIIPDFTIPDTVCVNTPVTITNKTVGATTNYWNFCVADLNQTPEIVNLGNPGNLLSGPVFTDFVQQNGNYFSFIVNNWNGRLTRLDFGNSLLNTPVPVDLGNLGGVLKVHSEGIQVIKQNNKWFAFVVGGDKNYETPFIIKIEFGTDITNLSPVATNLGNLGNMDQPIDFFMFQDGKNWYGLTVSSKNNTAVRFNFGSDFSNAVTAVNLGNLGGLNYPTGINAINKNGKWYVYITNGGSNNITRLDFGNSLLNTPVSVNLGNPNNSLSEPRDIYILPYCDGIIGFVVNNANADDIVRLNFGDNPESIPVATSLGNAGNFSFPHSISKLFRVGSDLYSFVTNVDNQTISRLRFTGCTNSSIPSSNANSPGVITYTAPGTYNINLTIDDGLATQASVCKQVVVLPKPVLDFSYTQNNCNPLLISFYGSDSSGKVKWDFGDGTFATGSNNVTHIFSKTGTYNVTFTYNGLCPSSVTKSILISIINNDIIKNKDTVICENGTIQLRADSALSYCWSPTIYLNNANISNPVATPLKDTKYTLVSKTIGNNLVNNGDFSNGNTGFISSYTYSNSGISPAVYFVAQSPNPWHPAMPFCKDHTTGTGNMMLVNGAEIAGVVVWSQKITVTPNTYYEFSCWLEHITTVNPAKLHFSINGIQIGNVFNANNVSCIWDKFFANWNSGSNTTADIAILNMNTGFSGNDFALDDISFAPVIYKTDSVSITINKPFVKTNNDTTVCPATPVQLNTTGATKYLWSPSAGLSNNTIANPVANVSDTTRFIVTGTNSFGCVANDTVVINVIKQSLKTIDFSYQPDICNPLQVKFVSSSNINAFWNFGDGSPVVQQQNPMHLYNKPGLNTVSVWINGSGCQLADTVSKNISTDVIKSDIIISRDSVICPGTSIQLKAVNSAQFCWSPSTYLNSTSVQNPVAKPLSDITYYLTAKETGNNLIQNGNFSNGNSGFTSAYKYAASNTTEGEYAVGPNPQAWNSGLSNCSDHTSGNGNMMLVNGSPTDDVVIWSQTVNVAPNTNYEFATWIQALFKDNPARLQFSINGNVLGSAITALLPTCTWSRFATNWNSGSSTTAVISIVNKNALVQGNDFALDDISFAPFSYKTDSVVVTINKPMVKAGNDTAVCAQSLIQLTAAGAKSYSWTPGTGLSNNAISNPVASIKDTAINYIVTGINAAGCTASDTVRISILPRPVITVSNDTAICGSGSLALKASGGISYQWSPVLGLDNPASANPVASPSASTTYTVKVTDGNSCTAIDSVAIKILPAFTIKASNDTAVCSNSKLTLQVTGATGYQWSPAATLSNANIVNPVATPLISTLYKVIGYNADHCTATDSVMVTALALPVISLSKDTAICKEGAAQLHASGGVSYNWSPSAGLTDNMASNPIASPGINTVYSVQVTGANSCKSVASLQVSILPAPVIKMSKDTAICGVATAQLTVSGGASYLWSPSAGLSDVLSPNPLASPASTTVYTVKVTGANSCLASGTVTVKVFPAIVSTISHDTAVCGTTSVQLMATGGIKYQWSPATGLNNTAIGNPMSSTAGSITYSVKIINADNCVADKSVSVNRLPLPAIALTNDTTICRQTPVQLNVSGGKTYQWSPATSLDNPLVSNPVATPLASAVYKVVVTDANNCSNSDSVSVVVRPAPQFGVASDSIFGCAGSSVQLQAFGGDQYQWTPATGLSNSIIANPVANLQSSQTYSVLVTESVCKEQASFTIPVIIKSLPPLIVAKSNDITCNTPFAQLNVVNSGISYNWQPAAGLSNPSIANPVASPAVATVYTVAVLNDNGCIATGSVAVKVMNNNDFRLYNIPNGFTPNGDGKNDCFGVAKWGHVNIIYFQVYNRWGQLVFTGTNANPCWDGTFRGIAQPSENFVYKLKVETMCGIVERQGNVVLIR